jgi:rubrerythrin
MGYRPPKAPNMPPVRLEIKAGMDVHQVLSRYQSLKPGDAVIHCEGTHVDFIRACEYCGSNHKEAKERCPNCGAPSGG